MKVSKLLATVALSAMLFTGCGVKNNNAIIKVNDKAISQSAYDRLIDQNLANSPFGKIQDVKNNKDGFFYLMLEQRVVNQLIVQELLNQEADKRGIKISDKDLNEAMQKVMEQVGGKDQLAQVLKTNNVSVKQFKEDLRNQVRMQKLAGSVAKVSVSDKECKDFYKKNLDKFTNPDKVRASHILIGANEQVIAEEIKSASKNELSDKELKEKVQAKLAEKKALVEKLDKELKADKSKFEEYAKKYSEDPGSAKQGGDLGFFAKDQMVPEFANVAFSAKPDTVSDVVKSSYGYHIIYVKDRRAAGITPYEKAQSSIKEHLVMEKQIKSLDDLTTAAKKTAKIEYLNDRYNPETIQKKLSSQINSATGTAPTAKPADTKKK